MTRAALLTRRFLGVPDPGDEALARALFEATRGRRHAESLAPAIQFVCQQADVELAELGAIAVDVGPGLFTGMRVGIATAKTLAMALRIPVVPIVSLDLLAYPLRRAPGVIAAVQAGIDAGNAKLSRVEQVKKFEILPSFWMPGGDELTPTLKLKRRPIAEKYAGTIDGLYA